MHKYKDLLQILKSKDYDIKTKMIEQRIESDIQYFGVGIISKDIENYQLKTELKLIEHTLKNKK